MLFGLVEDRKGLLLTMVDTGSGYKTVLTFVKGVPEKVPECRHQKAFEELDNRVGNDDRSIFVDFRDQWVCFVEWDHATG